MKGTHGPCFWCGEPNAYDWLVEHVFSEGSPICSQCKLDFGRRVMSGTIQMDDTFKERLYGQGNET